LGHTEDLENGTYNLSSLSVHGRVQGKG